MTPLFIGGLGAGEMALILVALLLMFGGRKLPELMRGAGKGIREFKDAMNGTAKDSEDEKKDNTTPENIEKISENKQ